MKGIFLQNIHESVPESLGSVEAANAGFWCAPLVPVFPLSSVLLLHFPRGWLFFLFPSISLRAKRCGFLELKRRKSYFPPSVFSDFNGCGKYGSKAAVGWELEVAVGLPWDVEVDTRPCPQPGALPKTSEAPLLWGDRIHCLGNWWTTEADLLRSAFSAGWCGATSALTPCPGECAGSAHVGGTTDRGQEIDVRALGVCRGCLQKWAVPEPVLPYQGED